ncbi:hypothetical protein [Halodesulfovibrio aestuarii]|uniref:hypothetical protein n=1 Tax=Halodesulfovibrio aestuarii TaxID=126333 RepID=UPI000420AD13
MKCKLIVCSLLLLVLTSGCVGAKKNVANNMFISEGSPTASVLVPDEFLYIGNVKYVEREDRWRWDKEAFVFIDAIDEKKMVERCLYFETNRINTSFVSNIYGQVKDYIANNYVQVNDKMNPTLVYAVYPSNAGYVTNYIFEKGYASPTVLLVKVVTLPVRKNLLFSVTYSEDVSSLGYSVDEWNKGELDGKQSAYLNAFYDRFSRTVDFSKIKHH